MLLRKVPGTTGRLEYLVLQSPVRESISTTVLQYWYSTDSRVPVHDASLINAGCVSILKKALLTYLQRSSIYELLQLKP